MSSKAQSASRRGRRATVYQKRLLLGPWKLTYEKFCSNFNSADWNKENFVKMLQAVADIEPDFDTALTHIKARTQQRLSSERDTITSDLTITKKLISSAHQEKSKALHADLNSPSPSHSPVQLPRSRTMSEEAENQCYSKHPRASISVGEESMNAVVTAAGEEGIGGARSPRSSLNLSARSSESARRSGIATADDSSSTCVEATEEPRRLDDPGVGHTTLPLTHAWNALNIQRLPHPRPPSAGGSVPDVPPSKRVRSSKDLEQRTHRHPALATMGEVADRLLSHKSPSTADCTKRFTQSSLHLRTLVQMEMTSLQMTNVLIVCAPSAQIKVDGHVVSQGSPTNETGNQIELERVIERQAHETVRNHWICRIKRVLAGSEAVQSSFGCPAEEHDPRDCIVHVCRSALHGLMGLNDAVLPLMSTLWQLIFRRVADVCKPRTWSAPQNRLMLL